MDGEVQPGELLAYRKNVSLTWFASWYEIQYILYFFWIVALKDSCFGNAYEEKFGSVFELTVSRMGSLKLIKLRLYRTGQPQSGSFNSMSNGSVGIVQKIDFEIRPDLGCTALKTSRKAVLDNLSVCLSCCRFSRELSRP